jgi:hypothetical protein
MSTRQLRLSSREEIRKRLQDFSGKKINIVLTDNTPIVGVVSGITDSDFHVTNMRKATIKLAIDRIREIYFDTKE